MWAIFYDEVIRLAPGTPDSEKLQHIYTAHMCGAQAMYQLIKHSIEDGVLPLRMEELEREFEEWALTIGMEKVKH